MSFGVSCSKVRVYAGSCLRYFYFLLKKLLTITVQVFQSSKWNLYFFRFTSCVVYQLIKYVNIIFYGYFMDI